MTQIRTLIVDDSAIMRKLLRKALAGAGVDDGLILEAGNGAEALEVLKTKDVDLLFTDINMPVMNGIALLAELATFERWQNLTRVIISTDGSACRDSKVDAYLEKPFSPDAITAVLAKALQKAA